MNTEVITLGETMVILEATDTGPLRYTSYFQKRHGGAESNFAIGIQKLGHTSTWVSKVGEDELGEYLLHAIRGEGVRTEFVTTDTNAPTGLYFKEKRRPGQNNVYYYRVGSAASRLSPDDLGGELFSGGNVLHLTGITPFLSESCDQAVDHAIEKAREQGLLVSFDPNLRFKLMTSYGEERARERIRTLAAKSDLFLPGLDEAEWLYDGLRDEQRIAARAQRDGAKDIVIKNGSSHSFYADRYGKEGRVASYAVEQVVDPIGAGDGFAAGVVSGWLEGASFEEAVRLGSAVGALVVSSPGDIEGLPTRAEVEAFTGKTTTDVSR
ncbi:sugar kinase [Natribacillus halophilus]|uniref:5-dehydro-2-deoxygluconokinase n=1 Tax=Natribacillus halophilus TaxID=549003 RepID=A0A1G8SD12_9BACI|nr:sugar kinase [Natribacillus halophilus]SDJ26570.1 5-dehydro-2-deoxygluconokinase [Natribacillus halophilus]